MKKIIVPALAAILFAGASTAFAAEATGKIKSIDTSKDMVTLDNGSSYYAPGTVKLSKFKAGEKVSINYTKSNGKMQIDTMKAAS
jgi:Cu/Ag efflux protein CusF